MQYKYAVNPDSTSHIHAVYLQAGQIHWQWQALPLMGWYSTLGEAPNLIDVVIAGNQLCALDAQGFIYYYNPSYAIQGWVKDPVASLGVALNSGDAGNLYCTNQNGEVWYRIVPVSSWYPMSLTIAPPATWKYTVVAGDWLLQIVRREYGTWSDPAKTVAIAEQIKVLNPGVANWNVLHPGDVLTMPPK